ncbi:MAG: succinate dehydrogenase [Deferribacteraceae bacterium]|jgi:succinate dehydrogenase / fumarate reductase cytochrome b subunit|nr:succinate dehydrogenase [Deferribacteraceae bacterium]
MPRKDILSYTKAKRYRIDPGMLAWLFHRVSGVIIGLFLIFHILGFSGICPFLSKVAGSKGILAAVAFLFFLHAANGIRIIFVEFASSVEIKKFKVHLSIAAGFAVALSAFVIVKIFN